MVSEFYWGGGRKCLWITANKNLVDNIEKECIEFLAGYVPVKYWKLSTLLKEDLDADYLEILRVTYRELVQVAKVKVIEDWLGEDYEGLVKLLL